MNGSKHFLGALLLLLLLSCASSQQVVAPVVKPDEVTHSPAPPAEAEDTLVVHPADSFRLKDHYTIALILPLFLDSLREISDSIPPSYYADSEMGVEFYLGALLALDSLKKNGFRARVYVFDDANTAERLRDIAHHPAMKHTDWVIGPIYNNNLRLMAEYAKRDSFYLISPLSPADNITQKNPYYIMVNPGVGIHCEKLFDFVVSHFAQDHIVLLFRPGVEQEYASIFRKLLRKYHQDTGNYGLQFTEVNYGGIMQTDSGSLALLLDSSRNNVIIIPSVDKAYVHNLARDLFPLTRPSEGTIAAESYRITVVGLPVWGDQSVMLFEYVNALQVHFTSSFYVPDTFYSMNNPFYREYVSRYYNEPSEYAVKGFDMVLFFGKMLQRYGKDFGSMLTAVADTAFHTQFRFGLHLDESPASPFFSADTVQRPVVIQYIENKYLHLLKYQDNYLIKME